MAVELAEPLQVTPDRDRLARFESLYGRYHASLVSACTSIAGDRAAAEDLAQETMLRAYQHLDWLDVARAWPWLKTVASRLAIDEHRKWGRVGTLEDGDDRPAEASGIDGAETRQVLAEAMSRLPARQRLAMTLRYVADYDPAEAAAALHLDSSAFKQLLYRARGRLQTEYRRLTAGVSGIALLPLLLLRRARTATVRLRHSFAASRLKTLLHPALELGAALLVFGTLAMSGPIVRPVPGDGGSLAVPPVRDAAHLHAKGGAGQTIGAWFTPAAWLPFRFLGLPVGDGSNTTLLCGAPIGSGTPVNQVAAAAASEAHAVAPTATSAGEQAQSSVGCGGSSGSQPVPVPGDRGPGPVLSVSIGGVLVPLRLVVSQLPHGVAGVISAVLHGGPLPAAIAEKLDKIPRAPQPTPSPSKTDSSSKSSSPTQSSSSKGDSSAAGSGKDDSSSSSDGSSKSTP